MFAVRGVVISSRSTKVVVVLVLDAAEQADDKAKPEPAGDRPAPAKSGYR